MFAHGIMTGLFFALVGLVYERAHTRDAGARWAGSRSAMPAIAAFFTLAALSSLGLPGTAGFVAEFLVFLGAATGRSAWWTVPARARRLRHRGLRAPRGEGHLLGAGAGRATTTHLPTPRRTEWARALVLGAALVIFGFWPRLLLDFIDATTSGTLSRHRARRCSGERHGAGSSRSASIWSSRRGSGRAARRRVVAPARAGACWAGSRPRCSRRRCSRSFRDRHVGQRSSRRLRRAARGRSSSSGCSCAPACSPCSGASPGSTRHRRAAGRVLALLLCSASSA